MMTLLRLMLALPILLLVALPFTSAQIPGGSDIAINRTPVVGGTNGQCLYVATGKVGQQACGTGTASDIKVATTTITSGTTTRVLYDNAGVLGEYTNTQLTALINAATTSLSGAVPAWPNDSTTFFRGDGTYAAVNATNISSGTLPAARLPAGATLQASPSNPTGTTSGSFTMMGLGSTCALTPVVTGRVRLSFQGMGSSTISGAGGQMVVAYGTGVAPSNGAAATGTNVGSAPIFTTAAANQDLPFALGVVITGMTLSTAYWFDVKLAIVASGTATMLNVSCAAHEVL